MREVDWDGLHNTRDLGGLGKVRPGRIYRAPRLDGLSAAGWDAVVTAGVRTIVDLRSAREVAELGLPAKLARHAAPVEDDTDEVFMREWGASLNSPAYYPIALRRWPDLFVEPFRVIADAEDGGIVIHCSGGRDRTGLIVAMLLQLAGVPDDEIVGDYVLAVVAMNEHFASTDSPREPPRDAEDLSSWVGTVSEAMRQFLRRFDTEHYLLENGLAADAIARIRARLLDAA